MTLKERATKFADKFQSKTAKFLAFWGAMAGLLAIVPTIVGMLVWLYYFFVDIYNISAYVKEFRNATEYGYFMDMQHDKAIHEEMETVEMYGVSLEKTNNGDLWYFTTVEINGEERPVLYSANIKKKGQKMKDEHGTTVIAHIYIQNLEGEHVWIPDNE